MIYSVVVGENDELISNDWEVTTDKFGSFFISNNRMRQRIRIPKEAVDNITLNEKLCHYTGIGVNNKTTRDDGDIKDYVKAINVQDNLFLSSNKNMNLVYLFYSKDKADENSTIYRDLCYITINNNIYKLLKYITINDTTRIMQTYRKKTTYQGLAIAFEKGDSDIQLIELHVLNNITKRFEIIHIKYFGKTGNIEVTHCNVPKKQLNEFSALAKKYEKSIKHFKVTIPFDTLLTRAFIISDELYEDTELQDLIRSYVTNPIMIYVDKDVLVSEKADLYDEDYKKEVRDCIKECIIDEGIRAVTLVGVNVSQSFSKATNILYIFDFEWPAMTQSCIRSN